MPDLPPKFVRGGAVGGRKFTPVEKPSGQAAVSSTKRGYTYKWQQARARFLRQYPLCNICFRMGRTRAATVVDHIDPHRGDDGKFWDTRNWQALCAPCHGRKTAAEDGAFGNPVKGVQDDL